MKRLIIVVLVLMMVGSVFGVKVVLKDGTTVEGELRGKSGDKIYIYSADRGCFIGIYNNIINKILDNEDKNITDDILGKGNFNDNIDFKNCYDYSQIGTSHPKPVQKEEVRVNNYDKSTQYNTKFNPAMLAVGVSLFAIAVDNFVAASDINNQIKDYEELGLKTSKLKTTKSRKIVVGGICAVSSIINLTYSFERIEVQASPTSLSMSYKF